MENLTFKWNKKSRSVWNLWKRIKYTCPKKQRIP